MVASSDCESDGGSSGKVAVAGNCSGVCMNCGLRK